MENRAGVAKMDHRDAEIVVMIYEEATEEMQYPPFFQPSDLSIRHFSALLSLLFKFTF